MSGVDYLQTLAPAWVWWTGYGVGCALSIVAAGAMNRDGPSGDGGPISFVLCIAGWPVIVGVLAPLALIGGLYHFGTWLAGIPQRRRQAGERRSAAEVGADHDPSLTTGIEE